MIRAKRPCVIVRLRSSEHIIGDKVTATTPEMMTAPAKVSLVASRALRITIHEGRNRQVRRMCEAVGCPVTRLVRTRIGPIVDRRLRPGGWRPLTAFEIRELQKIGNAR